MYTSKFRLTCFCWENHGRQEGRWKTWGTPFGVPIGVPIGVLFGVVVFFNIKNFDLIYFLFLLQNFNIFLLPSLTARPPFWYDARTCSTCSRASSLTLSGFHLWGVDTSPQSHSASVECLSCQGVDILMLRHLYR